VKIRLSPKAGRPEHKLVSFWKRYTTGSTNRRVFRAVVIIAILTSVARLAAFAKEVLVARRFGTGSTIEAFLVAVVIPALAINVISYSMSIALIPTYISARESGGKEAAQRLLSGITVWSLFLLGAVTVIVVASSRFYLPLIASGFDQKKLGLAVQLLMVVAPIIVLSGIANIWGAVLNAGERFALVALAPVITPSVTVLVLLIARYTIFALPVGMVIGAAIEMVVLGMALKLRGISLRPRWYGFDSQLRQVAGQFGPRVGASLLRNGSTVVDRSLAAMLPPGNVAALSYGGRITAALLSVAGVALGSAITPYYSNMAAQKDWEGLRHTLKRYLLLLLLVSIPVVAFLFFFAAPIVQLVFQRGSFRLRDTMRVAPVQALYAFQIPFYLGSTLLGRFMGSVLASHVLVWAAALNVSINVILDVVLIRRMGVEGIALATSCASFVSCCFLIFWALKILRARSKESSTPAAN
jgi:putative peptidoglycan lipid II flippase